jgi:hypothetical protein
MKGKNIIFLVCLCVCSCGIFSKSSEPSEPNWEDLIRTGISDSTVFTVKKTKEDYKQKIVNVRNQLDSTRKLGSETLKKINENFSNEDGDSIIKELNYIGNEKRENDVRFSPVFSRIDTLLLFFDIDTIIKIRAKLIEETVDSLKKEFKKNPQMKKNDAEYYTNLVDRKLDNIVDERLKLLKNEDITLSFLIRNDRTTAIKICLIDTINHFLKDYQWKISNNSCFDTGSDNLNDKDSLIKDISTYIDSLFKTIIEIGNVYSDTTSDNYNIELNIFVTGYADAQGWKGIISEEKNKIMNIDLSKRRADKIVEIFLDVYKVIYDSKIKRVNTNKIHFIDPKKSIIGLGEELPDPNSIYRRIDEKRRVVKLKCRIIVKNKN